MYWGLQVIPQDLGIEEGMNGTIQVVSSEDGEGGGGLYNVCICPSICFIISTRGAPFKVACADMLMVSKCADITFSSTAPLGPCINGTGVTTTGYSGPYTNANETGGGNGTSTPIGNVPSAPQSKGAARKTELGVWGLTMGAITTILLW